MKDIDRYHVLHANKTFIIFFQRKKKISLLKSVKLMNAKEMTFRSVELQRRYPRAYFNLKFTMFFCSSSFFSEF